MHDLPSYKVILWLRLTDPYADASDTAWHTSDALHI